MNRKNIAVSYRQDSDSKKMLGHGMQLNRARKRIAIVCMLALLTSFSFGEPIQAAQNVSSGISQPPVSAGFALANDLTWANPTPIAAATAALVTITLITHSLLTSGKQGWGWATLCVLAGTLMIIVRLAVSLFREISSANSIADWDE